MTFHEQDSKIKAKKKRQAVPCIEKSTGQDKGEIAMKILNGKVFENGIFIFMVAQESISVTEP